MAISILALSLALAVTLLLFGLRGRRVDDHPLCRRCGFDLTGRPESSTRCAESGADLARPRAIRAGRQVRRRRVILLGTTLLVPAVGGGALLGWAQWRGFVWQKHKPVWLLAREAVGRDQTAQDAALTDLHDVGTVAVIPRRTASKLAGYTG